MRCGCSRDCQYRATGGSNLHSPRRTLSLRRTEDRPEVAASTSAQVSTNRSFGDTVSAVVSPAVLATAVLHLSNWSYMQTANVLFGYYVAEKLEVSFEYTPCRSCPRSV